MAAALLRGVRRFPWLCNVLLYGGLFAAGDAAQQLLRGQPPDWAQTRRVALVALAFHGNFSYVWLRALERALPGRRPPAVLGKVLCDQLLGAPVAVLAFYTGECRGLHRRAPHRQRHRIATRAWLGERAPAAGLGTPRRPGWVGTPCPAGAAPAPQNAAARALGAGAAAGGPCRPRPLSPRMPAGTAGAEPPVALQSFP